MSIQPVHRRAKTAFVPYVLAAIITIAVAYTLGLFGPEKAPATVTPLATVAVVVAAGTVIVAAKAKKQGMTFLSTVSNLLMTARRAFKQIIAPRNHLAFNGLSAYNDTGQLTKGTSWTSGIDKHRRMMVNQRRGRHVDRGLGTDKKATLQTAQSDPLQV